MMIDGNYKERAEKIAVEGALVESMITV